MPLSLLAAWFLQFSSTGRLKGSHASTILPHEFLFRLGCKPRGGLSIEGSRWVYLSKAVLRRECQPRIVVMRAFRIHASTVCCLSFRLQLDLLFYCSKQPELPRSDTCLSSSSRRSVIVPCKNISGEHILNITYRSFPRRRKASPSWSTHLPPNENMYRSVLSLDLPVCSSVAPRHEFFSTNSSQPLDMNPILSSSQSNLPRLHRLITQTIVDDLPCYRLLLLWLNYTTHALNRIGVLNWLSR